MEGLRYIEPQQVSHLVVTLELKWPQLSKQILLRTLTTQLQCAKAGKLEPRQTDWRTEAFIDDLRLGLNRSLEFQIG